MKIKLNIGRIWTVRFIIDYRNELRKSYNIMYDQTRETSKEENVTEEFFVKVTRTLSDISQNNLEKERFLNLLLHMENVAKIHSGIIDVNIDSEKMMGKILCICDGYYVVFKEKDLTRECFSYLAEYAESFFIIQEDGKIKIEASMSIG